MDSDSTPLPTPAPAPPGRFAQFPSALAARARSVLLSPSKIPCLLIHPDWSSPAPVMIWLHGRTAYKELDPGRYLRWMRAGVATCAIDLPHHGERADSQLQKPEHSLRTIEQGVRDVDAVVAALGEQEYAKIFDTSRAGLGGMSLGGMIALRRLCEPHRFLCAAVEGTTGFLSGLYFPENHEAELGAGAVAHPWTSRHKAADVAAVDPSEHIDRWRPIPLLAVHSRADKVVPWRTQEHFLNRLRERYSSLGADPALIETLTWEQTGAPEEHLGFGRVSNEAKNAQTEFLARHLKPTPSSADSSPS